ncbi:MAG: hypothetical protein AB7S78_03380 [Candidatus Omnitrophota bacterium]
MKNNIIKVILFMAVFSGIAFMIHYGFLSAFRRFDNEEIGIWNKVVHGTINADLVISGDSRALTAYDCRVISAVTQLSCFNLSVNGNLIDIQLARLRLLLKYNKHPKVLIQVLGRSTLELSTPSNPLQFVPFLNEIELYSALRQTENKDIFVKAKLLPLYGFSYFRIRRSLNIVDDLFAPNPSDTRINGYLPVYSFWNLDIQQFKNMHKDGITGALSTEGLENLKMLIRTCRENNIKLILVTAPMYVEGRELFTNKDEILSAYEEIARENNLPYLNYFSHPMTNNQNNFYDFQHTNILGAKVISEKLADDINSIILSRKPDR